MPASYPTADDTDPRSVDRRTILAEGGTTVVGAGLGIGHAADASPTAREAMVTVRRGTNLAVTASPDGGRIAFDLLGILWTLDAAGGAARRLTDDVQDVAQPDWSPDGSTIAFQSYRSGNFHIWRIAPDGTGLAQLTRGAFDCREPHWSPDGRSIVFTSDRTGRYALHILDVSSGTIRILPSGGAEESEPAWSPDGRTILYVEDKTRLMARPLGGAPVLLRAVPRSTDFYSPSEIRSPGWTRDGRPLHFELGERTVRLRQGSAVLIEGEGLVPLRVAALPGGGLLHVADGELSVLGDGRRRMIPFAADITVRTPAYRRRVRDFVSRAKRPVVGIASPMLSPDGRRIVFVALNDIYLLDIGGTHRRLVGGAAHKSHPCWSPDGSRIAYCSDRDGTFDIWLHELGSGEDRRVTDTPGAALALAWSPDGGTIAFLDQDGALHTVDIATGTVRREYDKLVEPGRPSFGPDGRYVALAAFRPASKRFREGLNEVLVVDRSIGKGVYAPIAPDRSIATRGDDGPVWSPDGRHIAYVFASTLWIAPVDAQGRTTGAARRLTSEASDAPSWSGDGRTLLYLSNGRLRLIDREGGAPRTVPLRLRWANAIPQGRTIVRAGRLWDGDAAGYREHADIVVDGNRIVAVRDADGPPPTDPDVRFVDAGAGTVIPGLIDMHTHRLMQHYAPGSRLGPLWLSMGITTTRSPGCPAYQMVADREALDSGARLGPRHFATGEAIDGSRIFYNFMRPVTEEGQIALEMSRARALGYDLVKTYVRLPHHQQAIVIEAAHAAGLPVTSHYHYPALHFGIDGMEHLGATSRLGYSRTQQTFGGEQEDATALFAAPRADRTPTLFSAAVLLLEDRSLIDDRRVRALYAPWDLDALEHRLADMARMDRKAWLRLLQNQVGQVKAVMERGWHVVTGTDAPIDFPAISLHLNLRGMTRFGVSPRDALLTATRDAGDALGGQTGAILPGRLADMIVVGGDPLADVAHASDVRAVILNGGVHDMEALLGAVPAKRTLASPDSHRPPPHDEAYWWHHPAFARAASLQCCTGAG